MARQTLQKYTYLASDVPTTEELSRLKEARKRVLLVIQTRWVLLGLFVAYGTYAAIWYVSNPPEGLSPFHVVTPLAALCFAVGYNAWYHYSYRWFSSFRHLNLIQLLFDLLIVTMVIHLSGGAVSWFWGMYFILILQASFLGESIYDAWVIGVTASLLYGALLTAEFYNVLKPVAMPFVDSSLQHNFSYEMLKWAWVSSLCLLFSGIGWFLIKEVREREQRLRHRVIKDGMTDIYNRSYFYLRLNSELERAKRYRRAFSLLVLDVDDFKRFNDSFGHQTGDLLLQGVADVLRRNIRRSDTSPKYDVDIPCRIGGEEFAVLLPEASSVQGGATAERLRESVEIAGATNVAEKIRRSIESLQVCEAQVTISVGVASFPDHATDVDALFRAADDAMYQAKAQGKNQVVVASVAGGGGTHQMEETLPPRRQPAA